MAGMLDDEPRPIRGFGLDPPATALLSLHAPLLRSVRTEDEDDVMLPPPLGCSREAARMGGGGATAGDAFCRWVTIPTTFFERRRSSRSCAIVGVWK